MAPPTCDSSEESVWSLRVFLTVSSRIKEVSSKPRKEYTPKPRMTLELLPPSESHNGGIHSAKSPGRSPGREVHAGPDQTGNWMSAPLYPVFVPPPPQPPWTSPAAERSTTSNPRTKASWASKRATSSP